MVCCVSVIEFPRASRSLEDCPWYVLSKSLELRLVATHMCEHVTFQGDGEVRL